MKVYKVGLIGYGFIGKVHTYGHRNIPLFYDQQEFRSEIAMVCTSKPESAAKAGAALGAKGVTDLREITENPDIDIVDIATPNASHLEAILSAIELLHSAGVEQITLVGAGRSLAAQKKTIASARITVLSGPKLISSTPPVISFCKAQFTAL